MASRKKQSPLTLYAVIGAAVILVVGFAIGRVFNIDSSSMLFVQEAVTGSFRPAVTGSGAYTLRLVGVKTHTLIFSDRPNRMVGSWTMNDFITRWGKGGNSFVTDPPNAVLLSHDVADGKEFAIVVELRNPVFNAPAGTLIYDARILKDVDPNSLMPSQDRHDGAFPEILKNPALFIDDANGCAANGYGPATGDQPR